MLLLVLLRLLLYGMNIEGIGAGAENLHARDKNISALLLKAHRLWIRIYILFGQQGSSSVDTINSTWVSRINAHEWLMSVI